MNIKDKITGYAIAFFAGVRIEKPISKTPEKPLKKRPCNCKKKKDK
jgi:hypothetical protein